MKLSLPGVDPEKKTQLFRWSLFFVLYLTANRIHFFTPHLLAPSALDLAIPFLPWTVWIYLSPFALVAVEFWHLKDTAALNRLVYALALAIVLSAAVFVVYPTQLARGPFHAAGLTGLAFRLLYGVDTPCNCLPSLHVSSAFVLALGLREERRGLFAFGLVMAALISLSTLTMKQHYVADVVGGLLVAVFCHAVTRPLVPERVGERWMVALSPGARAALAD